MPIQLRKIRIPDDITPVPPDSRVEDPPVFLFDTFLRLLLNQGYWVESGRAVKQAVAVETALTRAREQGSSSMVVDGADWALLVKCIEQPSGGLGLVPWAARQLVPYFDAITEAEELTEVSAPDESTKPKKRAKG